jgi:hypothetical protein
MARFIPDGFLRLVFVDGQIDPPNVISTSTVAGGTEASGFLRAMSTPLEGSIVDISDVLSRFNKTAAGTYGGQEVTFEFYRDDTQANDTMWNLLVRGTRCTAVVCRRGGSGTDGAIAAGDHVDVWPLEVITRNPADYARNEPTGFTVSCAVPIEPAEDVVVGGGS